MKKFIYLFFIFFLLIISCNKDEKKDIDVLFDKSWKVGMIDKNLQSNPNGRIFYNAWLECEKDDIYTFFTDTKQLVIEKGSNKCDSSEPSKETHSYSIDTDSKTLIIDNITYTIADFSESQIKYYAPLPPPADYDYIVYLLH